MWKMESIPPDVFVFLRRVPPVPGVARRRAWWLQKQGLGACPGPCMRALSSFVLDASESFLTPVIYIDRLSLLAELFYLNRVDLLIQVNHSGFDHYCLSLTASPSLSSSLLCNQGNKHFNWVIVFIYLNILA